MGRYRNDDSVQSANTPTPKTLEKNKYYQDFNLYKCMITDVFYSNDPRNITRSSQNPEVIYECVVLGGHREGTKFTNVRLLDRFGGDTNYSERVLRKTTKSFTGSLTGLDLREHDGDIVYVQCVNGNPFTPVIIGLGTNLQDRDKTGATLTDGPLNRWEYNGLLFEVNKDGELTIKRKGGLYNPVTGNFTPVDSGDEAALLFTQNKASLTGGPGGANLTIDGNTDTINITTATGIDVSLDGAGTVSITTPNGTAEVSTSGVTLLDALGGSLNIAGGKVALGGTGAELLDLFERTLTRVSTVLDNILALTVPTAVGPSGTPINSALFTLDKTDIEALKVELALIKGSL